MLPRGNVLPPEIWRGRHRGVVALLWLHVPVVFAVAVVQNVGLVHSILEVGLLVVLGLLAVGTRRHQRLTMLITSIGLLTCSAELVHLSHGLIEMHFHFFVMVGVVTLYQDWTPFLGAIAYVVLQHGVAGALAPASVYNHPDAVRSPWTWAGVHGGFILAMSVVGIVVWRTNETLLDSARDQQVALQDSERDLRQALSLLSATLESTADGVLVVDLQGSITSFNGNFVQMWGLPSEILAARDDDAALAFVIGQLVDPAAFAGKVAELYHAVEAESYDTIAFKDGRILERYSKPQRVEGVVVGRVWSFRDVTSSRQLAEDLSHLALHDSLTDLANQALFRDRVDHALARRTAGDLAVLFLDLDNFKTVNDSLGHSAGDDLLVGVTARIRACLREADTAARLGGDEFAVLLEDLVSMSDAIDAADRLLRSLHEPFVVAGREVVISGSIGIALDGVGTSSDQMLRNADLAMYRAKASGKGRYVVFEPGMHAAAVERLEIEGDLRRARERGELVVHYQPIVALGDERVVGVEALVRWQHPHRGLLGPDVFIGIAEDTGLIDEIGRWVLEQACAQAVRWHEDPAIGVAPSMSVNLSPRQLRDERIVNAVDGVLRATGLPPGDLTLEITEGAMMHDPDAVLGHLRKLKLLGVRLAIDDFGTGYSSFSYLQQFPIDIIKIDRSFVARIEQGPEESALTKAILQLAKTLRLVSVAEGVERREQARLLAQYGCDNGQGYLFHRPEPSDEITSRLRAEPAPAASPPLSIAAR